MKIQHFWLLSLILIVLVGCMPLKSTPTSEPFQSPSLRKAGKITPSVISDPTDPALQELVRQAKEQMFRKFGIAQEQISLLKIEPVEWPDASLGCAQPGMMYAQVVTPGYQILLEANGQIYSFHSKGTSQIFLCGAGGRD